MRSLSPLLIGALACSCAVQLHWDPPAPRTTTAKKVFDHPFDAVWSRCVAWFASHNITIEKIEKPSGLITASCGPMAAGTYLNTGRVWATGTVYAGPLIEHSQVDVNVLVRPITDQGTEVTMNVFGSWRATAYWGVLSPNPPPTVLTGPSTSTGVLENQFFQFLSPELWSTSR